MSKGSIAATQLAAPSKPLYGESAESIAHDVAIISELSVVPNLLTILCSVTGMRFAAVARVTAGSWTACVGNALTHGSSTSPIKVFVGESQTDLIIQVWNDGDPIPAASIDKIFEPFWRRTSSADRQGLGLGLHICAQIIRAHAGTISVSSSAECSTQFTVLLPLQDVA
ncbi:MAG TPA: ATP-binding protein [Steroidobacteraceae bacterium]